MTIETPAATLLEEDRRHLVHPLQHPADHAQPIVFVRGHGSTLTDINGKEYLDGLSCLWNVNVGHGRQELADVAAKQMAQLAFVTNYVGATSIPAIELAAKLVNLAYSNMRAVYFTTGGAEANESAFKTARHFWKVRGRPEKVKFISRVHGYHGVTMAAGSATGMASFHKMYAPIVPNFVSAPPPHPYRWQDYPGASGEAGTGAADALEQVILREGPETVAAVIAEPVQGAGGVIVPAPGYFERLRAICDAHEILFIADEIITGFCRTGTWFALEHFHVQPDIMSFAKGVTSAYLPLGGIMLSERVHETLLQAPADMKFTHAATYSGHPTCCAVAIKNIEILEREELADRAAKSGKRLLAGLETLRRHHIVGDVRGLGMMCGVELVEDQDSRVPAIGTGAKVIAAARERGLFTRIRAGMKGDYPIGDTICIAPPLTTSDAEIDRLVAILDDALATVSS